MNKISRNCQLCNAVFDVSVYEVSRGNGKFCSRKCSRSKQAKINAENMKSPLSRSERLVLWKNRTPDLVHKAHNLVDVSIANGSLVRMPCEVCGQEKVDAHHDDYSKPLAVRWLCRKHHLEHHRSDHQLK